MVVRPSHFSFSALEKSDKYIKRNDVIYMTNSNEHKTISPEFKQLLHDIISDISALISEYLGVPTYDESKIREIVDGALEPNTDGSLG